MSGYGRCRVRAVTGGTRLVITMALAGLSVAGCVPGQDVIQSSTMGVDAEVGDVLLRSVHIEAPTLPAYPPGSEARLWFTIVNSGREPDTLTAITSPVASETRIWWDHDCDGEPRVVPHLPVRAAGPNVVVTPTGVPPFDAYSGQLIDLNREVLAGSNVELMFRFARAGSVTVSAPVQPSNAPRAEPSVRCVPVSGPPPVEGTPAPTGPLPAVSDPVPGPTS